MCWCCFCSFNLENNFRVEILVTIGTVRRVRLVFIYRRVFLIRFIFWVDFEGYNFEEDFGRSLFVVWWEEVEI